MADSIDRSLTDIDAPGRVQREGTMREVRPEFQREVPRPMSGQTMIERAKSRISELFNRGTARDTSRNPSRR